ncbi:hypothetical protein GCM10022291_34980 [Postechiella marina]|uniref:YD repeat-containing protein n=1 Tax=Postechiella marina TaxID=943941 RepID=A0ABP8CIE6_9FLAO
MIRIKSIFNLLLFFIILNAYGQYIPTSPEAEVFQKHTGYHMNNSTGVPDISIPLHTISHAGYQIPLNLSYNNSGVRHGYNYDLYGFGWNLSGRGKISRSLKYFPDEWTNFVAQLPYTSQAYEAIEAYHLRVASFTHLSNDSDYDHDIFHASLPDGNSFSFIIENDGTGNISILNSLDKTIKISYDLEWYNNNNHIKGFQITNNDGVTYTFSKALKEYNYRGLSARYNVEWNLTRIDFPNSAKPIIYEYLNGNSQGDVLVRQITSFDATLIVNSHHCESYPIEGGTGWSEPPTDTYRTSPNNDIIKMVQQPILKKITYDDIIIEFDYDFYGSANELSGRYAWLNWMKISSINHTETQRFNFNMSEFPLQNSFFKLKKLDNIEKINSQDSMRRTHAFNYESLTNMPHMKGTDHWGYINGYMSSGYKGLPNFKVDLPGYFHENGFQGESIENLVIRSSEVDGGPGSTGWGEYFLGDYNKEPAGSDGLLSKITYPTGGYTQFSWERNKYYNEWEEDYRYSSGHRIGTISNFSKAGSLVNVDEYKYGEEETEHFGYGLAPVEPNPLTYMIMSSNKTLPISAYHPSEQYKNAFISDSQCLRANRAKAEFRFSIGNYLSLLKGRPSVVYPRVCIYHKGADGINTQGKTEYFYDYEDIDYNTGNKVFMEKNYVNIQKPYSETFPARYNKVTKKNVYAKNTVPYDPLGENNPYIKIREEENTWEYEGLGLDEYNITYPWRNIFFLFGNNEQDFANFEVEYIAQGYKYGLLTKKTISEYDIEGNPLITQTKDFVYGLNHFVNEEIATDSKGNIISTKYMRPQDYYPIPNSGFISDMLVKNMQSQVIEITSNKTLLGETTPKLLNKQKTEYTKLSFFNTYTNQNDYCILPYKQYSTFKDNSPYTLDNTITYNTTIGGNYPTFLPVQIDNRVSGVSSYLWDDQGRFTMAQINNANHSLISSLDGKDASYNSETLYNSLINLVPDALISTFSYHSLFGVTSKTGPNGITAKYEYDGLGRLIIIKDSDDRILSQNQYHYKGQQ